MARVTGIGGFFFRARDPEALNRCYGEQFGVVMLDSETDDDPETNTTSPARDPGPGATTDA